MADERPGRDVVNVLRIRFDEGVHADYPSTTLLIDGEDPIGASDLLIGFDPADILDSGALLPQPSPRRIALYRCGACGEAGCGCAAATIRRDGGLVIWEDFRDFVGEFDGPLPDGDDEMGDGRILAIPDFVFDAEQYLSAVAAATTDRPWETRARRLGRLLRDRLEPDAARWLPPGWTLGWVSATQVSGRCRVGLRTPNGQVVVEIPIDLDRSDGDLIESAIARLSSSRRADWTIVDEYNWPPVTSTERRRLGRLLRAGRARS